MVPQPEFGLSPVAKRRTPSPRDPLGFKHWGLAWAASAVTWFSTVMAQSISIWAWQRAVGSPSPLSEAVFSGLALAITATLATPCVLWLVFRYPIEGKNWETNLFVHISAAFIITTVHILIADFIDPIWDPKLGQNVHIIALTANHTVTFHWHLFRRLFLFYVSSDVLGIYVRSVLVGYIILYYRRVRDREVRSAHLETQLARAHLQALKSQLQPHFLFNTLHSISALMLTNVAAADLMLVQLSDLLRLSLDDIDLQITTVHHEFEFVELYLAIEKTRYRDRLTYSINIEPAALSATVPHLLIQPLVENAVRHGIGKILSGGHIRVSALAQGQRLVVLVEDNGVGIDPSTLSHGYGRGLKITKERLRMLYKDRQLLRVDRGAMSGTRVRIELPFEILPSSDRALTFGVAAAGIKPSDLRHE